MKIGRLCDKELSGRESLHALSKMSMFKTRGAQNTVKDQFSQNK